MSTDLIVQPFPEPGPAIKLAYSELNSAANGTGAQRDALGPINKLPRPWMPATCTGHLRMQLWNWLEAVVVWINTQYSFDINDQIPSCWPRHPHIVHELAVIADMRWAAQAALSSEAIEEWHRYALPAFLDRMKSRIHGHCNSRHPQQPPYQSKLATHLSEPSATERAQFFARDLRAGDDSQQVGTPTLRLVDDDGILYE